MNGRRNFMGLGAMVAVLALVLSGSIAGFAQDATPITGDTAAYPPRPAHIHIGSCPDVGEVIAPLADVSFRDAGDAAATPDASMGTPGADMATPMAMDDMGVMMGAAVPAAVSVTIVELSLADILAGEHAINLHESAENIQNYISCGDIAGMPDAENSLYIGLAEVNDSGFSGIAWLRDNGDGTTYVTLFLAEGLHGADSVGDMATPQA